MDWPPRTAELNIIEAEWDHFDREENQDPKKSFQCPLGSLENYSWRLLGEIAGFVEE